MYGFLVFSFMSILFIWVCYNRRRISRLERQCNEYGRLLKYICENSGNDIDRYNADEAIILAAKAGDLDAVKIVLDKKV